jgi:hypothetical protein
MENYSDDAHLDSALLVFLFALLILIVLAFLIPISRELRSQRRDPVPPPPPPSFELQIFRQILPFDDVVLAPPEASHAL